MLLKVALNGARPKSENGHIPQTLAEIEREVAQIVPLGYSVFHIHPYDQDGLETLNPKVVSELISRTKRIAPQIQIGISTGEWIEPDLQKRLADIQAWEIVPDFASVNMIEEHAIEVAQALMVRGVQVEVGLNEKKAAEIWASSQIKDGCRRILIEPEAEIWDDALKTVTEIENVLNADPNQIKRLLHGFNGLAWDFLREAQRRGYDSRMGMEDTLYLENGEEVKSNLELIASAGQILQAA